MPVERIIRVRLDILVLDILGLDILGLTVMPRHGLGIVSHSFTHSTDHLTFPARRHQY